MLCQERDQTYICFWAGFNFFFYDRFRVTNFVLCHTHILLKWIKYNCRNFKLYCIFFPLKTKKEEFSSSLRLFTIQPGIPKNIYMIQWFFMQRRNFLSFYNKHHFWIELGQANTVFIYSIQPLLPDPYHKKKKW